MRHLSATTQRSRHYSIPWDMRSALLCSHTLLPTHILTQTHTRFFLELGSHTFWTQKCSSNTIPGKDSFFFSGGGVVIFLKIVSFHEKRIDRCRSAGHTCEHWVAETKGMSTLVFIVSMTITLQLAVHASTSFCCVPLFLSVPLSILSGSLLLFSHELARPLTKVSILL